MMGLTAESSMIQQKISAGGHCPGAAVLVSNPRRVGQLLSRHNPNLGRRFWPRLNAQAEQPDFVLPTLMPPPEQQNSCVPELGQ